MIKVTGADGIKYIIDGERYWPEEALKEALGCKDDDIFGEIKKLREERERYKSNCDYFAGIAQDRLCDRNKLELGLREALGIVDGYVDLIGLVRKLKQERDQLKEKCDKLKKRTNAAYGVSCGYSDNKAPAFLCDVISYSWEFGPVTTRDLMGKPTHLIRNDSIHVELELTPTENYKGTIDMEDLKRYIQEYGREKKLGVIESVDYQNAKVARAELAYLYKQVLGKDRLDRDLSPHEVMKAIHDEYKKVRDSQFAFSQSLRSVYMHIYEGTGYDVSDIYAAPDKIADWIMTRYDSTKNLGHAETLCDINDFIDELCGKYNVVQPKCSYTTRERLDYIFSVLAENRERYISEWKWVEQLKKEKQALIDSLVELRAKIREIYRSVVDDEWDESLSYTSALNDINEEYKRVVHNFEERTADWSKAQQELDRYCLAVESLLDIPKGLRGDISAIERAFTFSKKQYKSLQEFRDNVCEIFDIPSSMADNQILEELHDIADRYDELEDFRADICGALDIEGMLGTPQQNDKYILEQVEKMKDDGTSLDRYARLRSNICTALCLGGETSDEDILKRVRMTKECHDKLCKDYTKLHDDYIASQKQLKGFTNRCDSLEDLRRDLWEFRKNAIEDLKSRGFFFRPEENETLPEIYDKLLKRYDDYFSRYKEQYRLRQCWHVRWESENERANGVQKALDREREKCRVKDVSLETAKKQYEKVCNNLETAECALNGMKSKVRELREEKTKVISAIGQDIWDDAVK